MAAPPMPATFASPHHPGALERGLHATGGFLFLEPPRPRSLPGGFQCGVPAAGSTHLYLHLCQLSAPRLKCKTCHQSTIAIPACALSMTAATYRKNVRRTSVSQKSWLDGLFICSFDVIKATAICVGRGGKDGEIVGCTIVIGLCRADRLALLIVP